MCGNNLEGREEESGFCDSCYKFMTIKYPTSKLKWRLKCHKENAKKLKLRKQEQ